MNEPTGYAVFFFPPALDALGDAIKTSQRQGELSEEELSGVAGGVKCYRNMERFFGLVGSLFNTIFTSPW